MVYASPIVINADNVKLSGFRITSDGGYIEANGNQIQIINNNIMGNQSTAIALALNGNGTQIINNSIGPLSLNGSNQTIEGNQISGLATIWTNFNPISGAIVVGDYDNPISGAIVVGDYNLISGNDVPTIGISGDKNIVTGNSVIWNTSNGAGSVGIELTNANYNVVSNNTESGNNVGIEISNGLIFFPSKNGGSYNIFAGNTVQGAVLWGILMGNGDYNVFFGNLVANCGGAGHDGYGLALGEENVESATNNLFFGNIFMNNSKNFGTNWQVLGSNSFDDGKEGNYWDDYSTKYPNATEVDNSGIGNTPYLVYGNVNDNYPLMNKPNVSNAVPTLPSPWSSLLSSISSQLPSSAPTVLEFPTWIILPLFAVMILLSIVFARKRNSVRNVSD